jgi:hypothetical protein
MNVPDPMKPARCSATSKQTGKRCGLPPVRGATVCRFHGGAAPQVQRSARQRLAELAEPAVEALRLALESDETGAVVRAALGVLDRCGMRPQDRTVALPLPAVRRPEDVLAALGAVVEELGAGNITPGEALTVAGVLEQHRRALEVVELERRIQQLEEQQSGARP